MSDRYGMERAPVSGSCSRCGCALGFRASRRGDAWYCCGACAGSDRCACGCKPDLARDAPDDDFVPTRRMFAARHPDGLRTGPGFEDKARRFPFPDPSRGR
jgi:hypothetical protein